MPKIARVHSLLYTLIDFIVERIDIYFRRYYDHRLKSFKYRERPKEGPFAKTPSWILRSIIDKLVRKRRLTLKHLLVLLPDDADTAKLTCDEYEAISVFKPQWIKLILTRCTYLQVFHYHFFKGPYYDQGVAISIINDNIEHFHYLREINFHDSRIKDETLKVIASCCDELKILVLTNTEITDLGIKYLLDDKCRIKTSLTVLATSHTRISAKPVANIYLKFTNLKHFVSDVSIYASIKLLEIRSNLSARATFGRPLKAQTEILRSSFSPYVVNFPSAEILRLFAFMFSEVNYLILTDIKKTDASVINQIIPLLKKITILQLSAKIDKMTHCPFSMFVKSLTACGSNLITLKIEKFSNVDIYHLGKNCPNLERLLLINNSYHNIKNITNLSSLYKNLIELHVMLLVDYDWDFNNANLSEHSFFTLLLSSHLRKILVIRQKNFSDTLIRKMLVLGCLKNLEEVYIYECSHISDDSISRLVNILERIRKIEVGLTTNITEYFIENISTYIKNNNYDVSISMVNKLPAPIRKYVVDLPMHGKSDVDVEFDLDYGLDTLYR